MATRGFYSRFLSCFLVGNGAETQLQFSILNSRIALSMGLPRPLLSFGFDSPASFSAFVKKKTGLTASEIQAQVAEIHK
jgi:hypothetical protein